MAIKAPVYLRDLKKYIQDPMIETWKRKGYDRLLKAHENSEDIIVGYYEDQPEVEE